MTTFFSLFSGGGLADVGAFNAGCTLLGGLEVDPAIASVNQTNLKGNITIADINNVDPANFPKPDILWASPPCQNFSQAKIDREESKDDINLAIAISKFIEEMLPKFFILENVPDYGKSKSLQIIENTLYSLGYWVNRQVLNAADFGVPQNRRRLILRAAKSNLLPDISYKGNHVGWYSAIADLLDSLPDDDFAEWQIKRFPKELAEHYLNGKGFLVPRAGARGNESDCRLFNFDKPAPTIKSLGRNHWHQLDAFLFTKQSKKNWLDNGRVVAMTPHCLARFQSVPDWYWLPSNKNLACQIIGNGVPCLFVEKLILNLIGNSKIRDP